MEFKLSIRLGNDAMQTAEDIAQALRESADGVESIYDGPGTDARAAIYDANGNRVGTWEVSA